MSINKQLISQLNSKDYQIAKGYLKNIIKKSSLSNEDILIILKLSNKLIVGDFLNLQPKFSQSNLLTIEKFVNENLHHKNKLFVSDLIEFAIDFNLYLNYQKCLELLKKHKSTDHYVLMSSMEYLFFNFRMTYISELVNNFTIILNNKTIDASARLKAVFYLYRITYKNTYLNKLKKLVGKDSYNKEILKNLLKVNANKQNYFEGYRSILELTK